MSRKTSGSKNMAGDYSALREVTIAIVTILFALGKEVRIMPGRKHLKGVGKKEQRQYEHILQSARKSGRYGKRAEEVAARTVLKHHKEEGHAKGH
jgi:hypothetical protein